MSKKARAKKKITPPVLKMPGRDKTLLRLDLGCGKNKRTEGGPWTGVDSVAFPGVDVVADLRVKWPWADGSVAEAHCSHFVEHLTAGERVHFANELWRVLEMGAKCTLIAPHFASCRAYGDPTHQWPPFSEFWFYYLAREWRLGADRPCLACNESGMVTDPRTKSNNPCAQCGGRGRLISAANAPHCDASNSPSGFSCDFEAAWGYVPHPELNARAAEFQQEAFKWKKEAIQDVIATLTKTDRGR